MPAENHSPPESIEKSRTEALSDGIFAFAMTLLVISLVIPPIPEQDAPVLLPGILAGMWGEFLIFIIAFFIISSFWIFHHRIIRRVRYINDRLIGINLLFLFFIVLIPLTTTISGDYINVLEAVLFFHGNLLVASLLLTGMWWYIVHHYGELNPGGENPGWTGRERAFVIPGVSLLAIGISFIDTSTSMWCYTLIPLLLFIVPRVPGRRGRSREGTGEHP
jgi:uncharacterized membrane protein